MEPSPCFLYKEWDLWYDIYMNAVIINTKDNVGVALSDLRSGDDAAGVRLTQDVPRGHKFALTDIREGSPAIKYGCPIGRAVCDIPAGAHVHTHNIRTNLQESVEYRYEPVNADARSAGADADAGVDIGACTGADADAGVCAGAGADAGDTLGNGYFMGYIREDGAVGTRNEIWIIPTVGCVNKTAEKLAEAGRRRFKDTYAFTHPYGCSQLGDDHLRTQRQLARLAAHPNAGGVLVVGLGCENNNIEEFKKVLAELYNGGSDGGRVRFLNAQDCADELAEGAALLDALASQAERCVRAPAPLAKLRIGLKCGGSDGLSGITANPLAGAASDMVIRAGGAAILTEVPEMFGAEHILMNRCQNAALFDQTVSLINDFKSYYISQGQKIYENPSPGNKAGGISTLEDKSLGCTQKGGGSAVRAVLRYGEAVRVNGLNLLEGPGNDLIAVTLLTCAGAQIILFTTGRGTPAGGPVPTMKIASNSQLAEHKSGWIDFDAGRLTAGADFRTLADELLSDIIALASGEKEAKNEINGYREISLFKDGVIL